MASSSGKLKKKVKTSASQAMHRLDQALLSLDHSSIKRLKSFLKRLESDPNVINMIGRTVLQRADAVRQTLQQAPLISEPSAGLKKKLEKARVATRKTRQKLKKVIRRPSA